MPLSSSHAAATLGKCRASRYVVQLSSRPGRETARALLSARWTTVAFSELVWVWSQCGGERLGGEGFGGELRSRADGKFISKSRGWREGGGQVELRVRLARHAPECACLVQARMRRCERREGMRRCERREGGRLCARVPHACVPSAHYDICTYACICTATCACTRTCTIHMTHTCPHAHVRRMGVQYYQG